MKISQLDEGKLSLEINIILLLKKNKLKKKTLNVKRTQGLGKKWADKHTETHLVGSTKQIGSVCSFLHL